MNMSYDEKKAKEIVDWFVGRFDLDYHPAMLQAKIHLALDEARQAGEMYGREIVWSLHKK